MIDDAKAELRTKQIKTIPTEIFDNTLCALTDAYTYTKNKPISIFMSSKYIFVLPYIPYIYLPSSFNNRNNKSVL